MKANKSTKAARKALRSENESAIVTKVGLKQKALDGKLGVDDHKKIALAARSASQALRKSNPDKASALYYVFYKHSKLIGKPMKVARLSRAAKPAPKARKVKAAKVNAPTAPVTNEPVAA